MTDVCVLGVDPGPITGIAALYIRESIVVNRAFVQVSGPQWVVPVLDALALGEYHNVSWDGDAAIAGERFVVGPRAGRSAHAQAGQDARDVICAVDAWVWPRIKSFWRNAGTVKPWATDTRLAAAGLSAPTTGMRHARDAARHALYTAVREYGVPDPLSAR